MDTLAQLQLQQAQLRLKFLEWNLGRLKEGMRAGAVPAKEFMLAQMDFQIQEIEVKRYELLVNQEVVPGENSNVQ